MKYTDFFCYLRDVIFLNLTTHNDSHDYPVDSDGFTKDDADQILGSNSGRLDATADDAGAGGVDARGSADDGKRNGQTDSHTRPKIRRNRLEKARDIKLERVRVKMCI